MKIIFLFLCVFIPTRLPAAELVGAMSAGLGGTGRAAVQTNESVFLNPATIALFNRVHAGGAYLSGFTRNDVHRNIYSVVLTDGSPGAVFPGSLGYRRHAVRTPGQNFEENEFKVGAGFHLSERITLGFGFSYLQAQNQSGQAFYQSNGDIGLLIGLRPQWGLSLNVENLVNRDDSVPEALRRDSQVALGTQYFVAENFILRYETLLPLYIENTQYLAHRLGVAVTMAAKFRLNMGYAIDDSRQENWGSLGLAWLGPRLRFAYSFQREQRQELGDRHLVDLWLDF